MSIQIIGGTYKEVPTDFQVEENSFKVVPNPKGTYTALKIKCIKWEKLHLRSVISKKLQIPITNVIFAGLKDKEAVTTQTISIRASPFECLKLNSIPNLEILEMVPIANPLKIGSLYGNYFTITVRNTVAKGEILKKSLEKKMEEISKEGILNLFGEQRMGRSQQNYTIGRLLKGKLYKEALLAIVYSSISDKYSDVEELAPPELLEILIKTFPFYVYRAYNMYLSNKNAQKAIQENIPRSIIRFYHSSYESFGFNKRIEDPRSTYYYSPYNNHNNSILNEMVKINKNNLKLFEKKIRNKEGVYVYRVGKQSFRPRIFYPTEFSIVSIGFDFYTIKFLLPKGCYATEVIRNLQEGRILN